MKIKDKLNEKQENAIELILQGMNDSQVAAQVGVSRQWVNMWRNHDEAFIQALQERKHLLQEIHMNQLIQLVELSLGVIQQALQGVDEKTKLKTALQVLRISGLQGYTQPLAETTEEDRVKKALLEALEEVEEEMGIEKK